MVRRGEYIGREVAVEVPKWNQLTGKLELPQHSRTTGRRTKDLPVVDFTAKTEAQLPALLVDFHGGNYPQVVVGKHGNVFDEAATEMLVLTPEGNLMVKSSLVDSDPSTPVGKERLERYEAWKDRIERLKGKKDAANKNLQNPFGGAPPRGEGDRR